MVFTKLSHYRNTKIRYKEKPLARVRTIKYLDIYISKRKIELPPSYQGMKHILCPEEIYL